MLTVNHLTLSVRRQPLLQEVAFSVAPGEVLTLMGPSGSGKSTLFAWMIGALSGDFRAEASCGSTNALRYAADRASAHRHSVSGPVTVRPFQRRANLQLALPENVRGEARKPRWRKRLARRLAGFARAIRPRSPAGSGRGDLLRACWRAPRLAA